MLDFQTIISPQVLEQITVGVMISTGSGVIKAITTKQRLGGFLARIVSAAIMGAILGYALRNNEILPDFGKVVIYIAGGFTCAELAQLLSDAATNLIPIPKTGTDQAEHKNEES